jgi:hypothetical protein
LTEVRRCLPKIKQGHDAVSAPVTVSQTLVLEVDVTEVAGVSEQSRKKSLPSSRFVLS